MTQDRRLFFVVNSLTDLVPTQTTAMLMVAAAQRGDHPIVFPLDGITAGGRNGPMARGIDLGQAGKTASDIVAAVKSGMSENFSLDGARLMIRLSPGRDTRVGLQTSVLGLLQEFMASGTLTAWNDPTGLQRFADKTSLIAFPRDLIPETLVSSHAECLFDFLHAAPGREVVIKPARGSRGQGVFFLREDDPNRAQLVDLVSSWGPVVAQHRVPGAEEGDVRIVVLDGQVLRVGGHAAAIRRVPGKGDLRSNLHAGGTAKPVELSNDLEEKADRAAAVLYESGVRLAGLDFIGDSLIEANVFSTGGLHAATQFYDVDFCAPTLAAHWG